MSISLNYVNFHILEKDINYRGGNQFEKPKDHYLLSLNPFTILIIPFLQGIPCCCINSLVKVRVSEKCYVYVFLFYITSEIASETRDTSCMAMKGLLDLVKNRLKLNAIAF